MFIFDLNLPVSIAYNECYTKDLAYEYTRISYTEIYVYFITSLHPA